MQLKALPRAFYRAGRLQPAELSPKARERLRVLELWEVLGEKGVTGEERSRLLGASRATIYRWHGRWRRLGPAGLEEGSRAPRRRRKPTWEPELAQAVLRLRQQFPRWGKDKLAVLLARESQSVSTSMVGRILTSLEKRGVLREAPLCRISRRKRRLRRPYAIRKPRDYRANQPGDLVQVDTLDLRPLPGVVLKQFTARDVVSRWDVVEVYSVATSHTATDFLGHLKRRFPFSLRGIQVDGGSEFMASFEEACQHTGITLFVLPPRSPKLNGNVERAQRTHTEEFWDCYDGDLALSAARPALREWECLYNTFRPHQALAWLTPLEYISKHHPELGLPPTLSHM